VDPQDGAVTLLPLTGPNILWYAGLAAYFFALVPGMELAATNQRTQTGEVDTVLRNRGQDSFWGRLGHLVAVECKNWQRPVGAKEIRDFQGKLRDIGVRVGFYVSVCGLSGNDRRDAALLLRDCRKDDFTVIPVDIDVMRIALRFLEPTPAIE